MRGLSSIDGPVGFKEAEPTTNVETEIRLKRADRREYWWGWTLPAEPSGTPVDSVERRIGLRPLKQALVT
jgi:hypothetical protein